MHMYLYRFLLFLSRLPNVTPELIVDIKHQVSRFVSLARYVLNTVHHEVRSHHLLQERASLVVIRKRKASLTRRNKKGTRGPSKYCQYILK